MTVLITKHLSNWVTLHMEGIRVRVEGSSAPPLSAAETVELARILRDMADALADGRWTT